MRPEVGQKVFVRNGHWERGGRHSSQVFTGEVLEVDVEYYSVRFGNTYDGFQNRRFKIKDDLAVHSVSYQAYKSEEEISAKERRSALRDKVATYINSKEWDILSEEEWREIATKLEEAYENVWRLSRPQ
jgi:hypothetical protein